MLAGVCYIFQFVMAENQHIPTKTAAQYVNNMRGKHIVKIIHNQVYGLCLQQHPYVTQGRLYITQPHEATLPAFGMVLRKHSDDGTE